MAIPDNINEFLDGALSDEEPDAAAESIAAEAFKSEDLDAEVEDGKTYDAKYVKSLRQEAANYRNRAKKYEEAFDGYGEEDQAALFNLAKTLREDPRSAAQEMAAAAEAILAQYKEEAEEVENLDDQDDYLTVSQYKALKEQEQVDSALREIEQEAVGLGYKKGTVDYHILLSTAQHMPNLSLEAAHKYLETKAQAAVDAYVAGKTDDADSSAAAPPGNMGTPPSGEKPIKTWEDSKQALINFIAQSQK